MKKSSKMYIAICLSVLMLVSLFQLPNRALAADPLNINADAAILVEASTGKILYAKNEDTALGIASMTKMMTEYLMFEAIHDKKISWDQEHTISEFVHDVSVDTRLSNVPLEVGQNYTIRELYEAMAIFSANGATIAIAEAIAGSESAFVKMMNDKAKELGLDNYHFVNSTGLNNSDLQGKHPEGTGADEENVMSARSTAKLAMRIMEDFPEVLETTSVPKKDFRNLEGQMKNWNLMLPSLEYEYPGVDGLKTGTTNFAGRCFTGTAKRGDFRVITVVMNAKDENGNSSDRGRFGETKKMLDYAFSNFSMKEIIPKDYAIEGHKSLKVTKGKEKSVQIRTKDPLHVIVKNGQEESFTPAFTVDEKKVSKDGEIKAPIKKDEQVGVLTVVQEDQEDYGYVEKEYTPSVKVVTVDKVEKANWFVLMMRGVGGFFSDIWGSVTETVKGWF
ncbi:D-alanyl-D-alanine carboxypeptidase family protein [Bacillus sp. FJAT-50079]|uniref:D-alanyl-D-alanine carboxypeptidase family protein n=1 Tax=Bacillus sp. FJAT-50079 TaxID=2833577 RepID=UPI0032D5A364